MVQARGIQIRENVKNIGAQVLEQVVRGAYSINGTGKNMPMHTSLLEMFSINAVFHILTLQQNERSVKQCLNEEVKEKALWCFPT